MMEILQFIFSSFWVWAGSVILIATFGTSLAGMILAVRGKKDE
jgi:hypothetical protein